MNTYYLRFIEADWSAVYALGLTLGIEFKGYCWVLCNGNGYIYEPTGLYRTDAQGDQVPLVAPLKDPNGNPYIHANLRIDFDLKQRAEEIAERNPTMASAMQDLGRFFLLDAEGKPRKPNNPHMVFAGDN